MQKILFIFIVILLIICSVFGYLLYNDRSRMDGIAAINKRLETRLSEQDATIRSLEASGLAERKIIAGLGAENKRLRELQQQSGNIVTGLETAEGEHSTRLERLEQIIKGARKKD